MKWFTYCNAPGDSSWYSHRTYEQNNTMGLLFGTDDDTPLTEADLMRVVEAPEMKEIFKGGFFIDLTGAGEIIASSDLMFFDNTEPDSAKLDDPPILMSVNGQLKKIDKRTRYDNCLTLYKALGCAHCPDKGPVCLSREFAHLGEQDRPAITRLIARDVQSMFEHKKSQIAGFTFASPVMTATEDEKFIRSARPPSTHDFSQMQYWHDVRSDAGKKAAKSRAFKQRQCKRCSIKSVCSKWTYRHCGGRYLPDEELAAYVLNKFWPEVRQRMPWTDWQFWALANGAGRHSRIDRVQVILEGPEYLQYQRKWHIPVNRTSRPIEFYKASQNYDWAASLFDLPRSLEDETAKWMTKEPEDTIVKALYIMSLLCSGGNTHNAGFNGVVTDTVVARVIEGRHVAIKFACKSSMRGYDHTMRTFADFLSLFDRFPIELPTVDDATERSPGKQLGLPLTS